MCNYYKYPKTFHLPHSPNLQNDDRLLPDVSVFQNKEVVVTLKCDGENTTMNKDHIHARSLDSKDHASRHWVKALHASIKNDIPKNWRICGENLWAKHSIFYTDLPSYFLVFAIFDDKNISLNFDEMNEFCDLLDLKTVPIIYRGIFDIEIIQKAFDHYNAPFSGWTDVDCAIPTQEGYVARNVNAFHYDDFQKNVCKYVRRDHVRTSDHWLHDAIIPNKLKKV